jgi:integrase
MRWHAKRTDDYVSVIVPGMGRVNARERARTRVLDDAELHRFWQVASESGTFGALLKFLLLTGARRTEASAMMRKEVQETTWTLPAARSKTKQAVVRPLSAAAIAIVSRQGIEGFVFTNTGRRALTGISESKRQFAKRCGFAEAWRIHDLRRTSRSLMSRAGINPDIAERMLGHAIAGVRGIYDRHSFEPEMRRGYEALASLIERIVDPQPNVTAIRRG